ncbi:MAG: family 43 glycosylhydrolase [Bacteroides sp.]|nr:family 43 glycosylhydrolase [Roseburia sp.]MCM1347003.1 family 43 glycosylhydrolase [Bacteroides sp.]MCM1421567.1 family 43 glycosylhydrolase [Bacteroides sp.]
MKRLILSMFLSVSVLLLSGAPQKKIIDNGGSGPYKAEAVSDPTLPGYVVYRPADIKEAVVHEGPLPLFVFANGGCNDTSLPHEKMLNDIASYGYLVVALGEMQDNLDDRELHKSPNSDMLEAIDWAEKQNASSKSPYFGCIDLEYVALGGQSCGGAQTLANCGDSRVKTCLMINSGMGDIEMAGASRESLKNLHCPVLYLIGGESDIAYRNAELDYERIGNVPVAFANQVRVGHGGTFHEPYGGSFSSMARAWLNWQFKDKRSDIDVFLRNRLRDFPDYTMKAKNFPDSNNPFDVKEINIRMRDGKNLWGKAYIPNTKEPKKPMVIMGHGYNGTHLEPKAFAETLAMQGVASFIFDFCGGGNHSRSEGETTEMTVFTEKENIEDIAGEVKSWSFVDSDRIALLGCSQGGLVASLTAAANPGMFKSLILVYPALTIPETAPMMLKRFEADGNKPQDVMGMKLGRTYYEKINGLNVFDTIGGFKGDVFIVYGDRDMIVAGGVDRAVEKYDKVQTLVIPGGDHGFSNYAHHEKASAGIAGFVNRTLSERHGQRMMRHEFDAANPDVHDPVMAYEDGVYYMFTTGFGVGMMSSTDLINWKQEKSPLNPVPEWAKTPVPSYQGHTWAPDIIKVGDKWYLYYSCSTFYQNISAIGVAVNKTLNPDSPDYKWEDLGMVIKSEPGVNDWNAIDPNVIIDKKGNPWMTFGSFWDGIQLVKLKKDMKTPAGKPKTLARRRNSWSVAHNQPTANTNAIEAPFITFCDGYYYLFVSYDYCCKGLSSNYKIAVGRSKKVTGPYLDKNGKDMALTGGTILVGESDSYAGVGHCSVYKFGDKWYIAAHAYDKSNMGASKLFFREIRWENGWPVISD